MAKLSKSWDALNNTRSIKGAGLPSLTCWILGGCGFSMQPVHLQLHGFCLGSVAGEVAPKKRSCHELHKRFDWSSISFTKRQSLHVSIKLCCLKWPVDGSCAPFFQALLDSTTRNVQFYHEIYHATSQDHVAAQDRGKKKLKNWKNVKKKSHFFNKPA